MEKITHEQWKNDNDAKLLSILSNIPTEPEFLFDFVRRVLIIIPFTSVSEHQSVLEFKAVDSELEEKIAIPLDSSQIDWIGGYYDRNIESLKNACDELVAILSGSPN